MVRPSFAVVATTLALVSVLLPIVFLPGLTGRLFREFGLVLMGAVVISSFVALTLTPALCGILLGPRTTVAAPFRAFNLCIDRLTSVYGAGVRAVIRVAAVGVLLVGAPLPDAQDSRYRSKIYRGTSITV